MDDVAPLDGVEAAVPTVQAASTEWGSIFLPWFLRIMILQVGYELYVYIG